MLQPLIDEWKSSPTSEVVKALSEARELGNEVLTALSRPLVLIVVPLLAHLGVEVVPEEVYGEFLDDHKLRIWAIAIALILLLGMYRLVGKLRQERCALELRNAEIAQKDAEIVRVKEEAIKPKLKVYAVASESAARFVNNGKLLILACIDIRRIGGDTVIESISLSGLQGLAGDVPIEEFQRYRGWRWAPVTHGYDREKETWIDSRESMRLDLPSSGSVRCHLGWIGAASASQEGYEMTAQIEVKAADEEVLLVNVPLDAAKKGSTNPGGDAVRQIIESGRPGRLR